jgi:pyrimidine deaminase RibD-like protein
MQKSTHCEGQVRSNICIMDASVQDADDSESFNVSHLIAFICPSGNLSSGATAYVTLEPCNHFGRTPPCSKALVDAGIARVGGYFFPADPIWRLKLFATQRHF